MAYVSKVWKDYDYQFPTRYTLHHSDSTQEVVTIENNFGEERVTGDAWESLVMNQMEARISDGFDEAEETRVGTTDPTSAIGKNGDFYAKIETVDNVTTVVGLFVRINGAWLEIQTGGAALPQAEGSGF